VCGSSPLVRLTFYVSRTDRYCLAVTGQDRAHVVILSEAKVCFALSAGNAKPSARLR
jgi:hypothetical protein